MLLNSVFRSAIHWPTDRYSARFRTCFKIRRNLPVIIDLVRRIRESSLQVPLVLFSYYNPICKWDWINLRQPLLTAGADGVLVTDLAPEESDEYRRVLSSYHLDTVFLAAPTSTDERLATIAGCSTGFLYLVSRTGVTGAQDSLPDDLPALLRRVRNFTKLPVAVGFGISLPGHITFSAVLPMLP